VGVALNGVGPEEEDLRDDRGMARNRRSWAGEVRNVSLLVAIGMNESVLSEDSRHLRGGEGGQDWLEGVPKASQGTRVEGCLADHVGYLPSA
jgi:hypothetical protein